GFENKERSHPTGGIEWYLGLKEVEAYGRPLAEVGLLGFSADTTHINAGGEVALQWNQRELEMLNLHPGIGDVLPNTQPDGSGQRTVSPAVSTEFLLVGTNRCGLHAQGVTIEVDGQPLTVRFSEFVANNRLSLRDGHGEAPDWIELHNPTDAAVDLAGCGLSDDPAEPMRWVFPTATIPPHGWRVVFASGRNEPVDAGGFLHANFQLAADGESLVLTAADGITTLDRIDAYPAQDEDLAYGRNLDGEWTFLEPTPGAVNLAANYEGWLQPVRFSHTRGFQTNAFTLTLSQPDEGAEILYARNGFEPLQRYIGPMAINVSARVRAVAKREGYRSPRVETHSYIYLDDVISASIMNPAITQDPRYSKRLRQGMVDLPTLSVSVSQLPDDYVERPASVEIFWPDGSEPVQADCGMYRFGGAWTTFAKKNYRLKFRPEYGTRKLEAPLFHGFDRGFLAVDSFDELDLRGGSHDMLSRGFYMSARFTEDTLLDMGSLNPHGRFVHLYLNGVYWGQYHLRERLNDRFLADYLGGPEEDYLTVRGNDNVGSSFIPGTPDPPDREPWEWVRANRGSYATVKERLDVPHLIDFMLMWFYGNAETEYRAAGPRAPGSGFKFWLADADGYLRNTGDTTGNPGPGDLFGALTSERDPEFMTLLADRIHRHLFNDGALTPARNTARLDERMNEIANSLMAECARWGERTPENWQAAAEDIRTGMFPSRTATLVSQLRSRGFYPAADAPVFNLYGGHVTNGFVVTLAAGTGTLYYTLDGTDPRLPGGAVAPGAIAYSGGEGLFPLGSEWRYWDAGTLPAEDWNQPAYDDSGWTSGNAPLGYGNGDETTTLDYGGDSQDKRLAYYFRREFNVASPDTGGLLAIDLVRDDGAAVYLNGVELFRDNLPTGALAPDTRALTAIGGSAETTPNPFSVPSEHLVEGRNLLAVELHQASPTSSDIRFDLAVKAPSATGVTIAGDTVIKARVLSGTIWSALAEAAFTTVASVPPGPGEVLISEIHYNPPGSDDFEFLELYNPTDQYLDLTGTRLDGGVELLLPNGFVLAPGRCAVAVENAVAFDERYRTVGSPWYAPDIAVLGEWSGRLSDEGERVAFLNANLQEIVAVDYGTANPWSQRANGLGSSLELRDPDAVPPDAAERTAYLSLPGNWHSSSLYHGSPGRLDEDPWTLVISEVLAHTDADQDWVELHNTGSAALDLTGVSLSDHYDRPLRYAFPEETTLPPDGFLTLTAADLGFGFSELGSDILLVQAVGTDVVRFIDTVDFPAVEREEPFGRYLKSDGETDFTELSVATPDAVNARPRIGPVVFSEIMYHPAADQAEYVEILNPTDATVTLYDPAHPGNTWALSGAVDFTFPAGEEIPAGGRILVSAVEPAVFREHYPVPAGVPVYGPWDGALNNAGESLKLRRPGEPEPDGTVPYYRVDRVVYGPVAPWPTEADVGGVSLERVAADAYGNDPASWTASIDGGSPGAAPESVNRPPHLAAIADQRVPAEVFFEFRVTATDPDVPTQTLSFSASGLPAGVSIDSVTGLIAGAAVSPGLYQVTVTVEDDQDPALTDHQSFTLDVTEAFRVERLSGGAGEPAGFRFPALAGQTYEVQFSDRLSPDAWQLLSRIVTEDDGWRTLPVPPEWDGATLFLRVVWLR
ncbi:MAG: lamin tail domain-containing protein, partial [Verrucomicrobiae bacterium]|nr:lamin tail domain-containing protein [Verrucomicrobiae bacterium]